jgi:trehalose synthase
MSLAARAGETLTSDGDSWCRDSRAGKILLVSGQGGGSVVFEAREVAVAPRPLATLLPLVGADRYAALREAAAEANWALRGQTIWNISSTAAGGGVAEMLRVLIGYTLDAGIDVRWEVMTGDPVFFALTKRLHNRLHGYPGDGKEIDREDTGHYREVAVANAANLAARIKPQDVVLLHDPQTAGMADALVTAGAKVVWRCHVGRESSNQWTDQAWSFLRDHLAPCHAFVFSRRAYVPSWVDPDRLWVIPPSIDPFSPKNQEMTPTEVLLVMQGIGLVPGECRSRPSFIRSDGTTGHVGRQATIVATAESPIRLDAPLVVQVSRWDRLKDMAGVMTGFAAHVPGRSAAQLALVGPAVGGVTDDPEEEEVFGECVAAWETLPRELRQCIALVTLPMEDIDENAAMVNAIQRQATVVVQKSLEEGFGLTVAEGMWKEKAVVGSRVGGIVEQIAPGTGILMDDPTDLTTFGQTLAELLGRPAEIVDLGSQARRHVLRNFLGDVHLGRYAQLMLNLASN